LWLLSKESVINGELEKLLLVKPKDRIPVDKAILEDLKKWREALAKNIFKKNKELFNSEDREKDANYLKEITQKILDRIIFMRSCEDRNLIHRRPLKEIFEERSEKINLNAMIFLKDEFYHYDLIFNSDLFRSQEWEEKLWIDFKILKDIILDTYNPYQFDVIPIEVLGNIYEQYLGHSIRLIDHFIKYELKPELRKAGGVYYTPEYIVEYIVSNTVGKLLKELPKKKIKKLRILDPACGSGSFLIKAYEEMLNYYKNEENKQKIIDKNKLNLEIEKEEPLKIQEKSQILREHIFGVDIYKQAVEVTKLSLMLKMLEGEYGIIPGRAILPMLDKNIKCGNSLISGDSLELKKYFGNDWYIENPFNWEEEFKEIILDDGGFDVVIGNPPYIFGENLPNFEKIYYSINYKLAKNQYDIFWMFYEKTILKLKKAGMHGFIVPDSILARDESEIVRKFILDNCIIERIAHVGKVFGSTGISAVILILKKGLKVNNVSRIDFLENNKFIEINKIPQKQFNKNDKKAFRIYIIKNFSNIIKKIKINSVLLGDLMDISRGEEYGKKNLDKKIDKIPDGMITILAGEDIKRYSVLNPKYIIKKNKIIKNLTNYLSPKIVIVKTSKNIISSIDFDNNITLQSIYNLKIKENSNYDIKYILGILNSKLFSFYVKNNITSYKKLFPQINQNHILNLPIKKINFSLICEKKLYNDLINLVDIMIDLNRKLHFAKGSEKDQIQKQIEKTDNEIDEIIYKLYGITEEERKIIEEKT